MATILIEQDVDLKEIIVKTLRLYERRPRNVRQIEKLVNDEYGDSLHYSHNAFLTALEHLANDSLHMDNKTFRLCVKIYPRSLKRYEVKFWLFGVLDGDKVEGFDAPLGVQPPKEWTNPVHMNP